MNLDSGEVAARQTRIFHVWQNKVAAEGRANAGVATSRRSVPPVTSQSADLGAVGQKC